MGEINHIMLANKHVIYSISTPNLLMWTDVDISHIPVLMVHTPQKMRRVKWDNKNDSNIA